jgi:hypothetical protein
VLDAAVRLADDGGARLLENDHWIARLGWRGEGESEPRKGREPGVRTWMRLGAYLS